MDCLRSTLGFSIGVAFPAAVAESEASRAMEDPLRTGRGDRTRIPATMEAGTGRPRGEVEGPAAEGERTGELDEGEAEQVYGALAEAEDDWTEVSIVGWDDVMVS